MIDAGARPRRARRALLRVGAFIVLAAAFVAGWIGYHATEALHLDFAGLTRDLEPLYAISRVTDVRQAPGSGRFAAALLTVALGLGLIALSVARRWRTWSCLAIATVAVLAINVAVASIPNGYAGLTEPFSRRGLEYYPDVRRVGDDPLRFIVAYPQLAKQRRIGLHPATHPPGGVLFLYFGGELIDATSPIWDRVLGPLPLPAPPRRVGPAGPFDFLFGPPAPERRPAPQTRGQSLDAACWLAMVVTALGVLPAYWLATLVGGAAAARRMLPLYAVAPNLVLFGATSMDGVFLTFGLVALAAGVQAMRRWSFLWPIAAGAALWLATFVTFAVISVPILMGCYALATMLRTPRRGAAMLARCALVGVAFVGFQWLSWHLLAYDLRATVEAAMLRDEAAMGSGFESLDRYWRLALANGLAFAFGGGVAALAAVAIGVVRVWPRRLHAFTLAACACVLALSASTLFSLETERVWLCVTPPLLIGATRVMRGKLMWLLVIGGLIAQALWTEVRFRTYW